MAPALAFVIGLVFGVGLLVSGMTDPAKVLAFLDLAGAWDPSLAVVMAAAVPVAAAGFVLARHRAAPLVDATFHAPRARALDRRLVLGSIVFGAGWGLVGLCPGPALVVAGSGSRAALVFVAAMIAGFLLFDALEQMRRARETAAASS